MSKSSKVAASVEDNNDNGYDNNYVLEDGKINEDEKEDNDSIIESIRSWSGSSFCGVTDLLSKVGSPFSDSEYIVQAYHLAPTQASSIPNSCLPAPPTGLLKVLIVDDSVSIQKMLSRWLERNQCVVVTASNGKEGLDLMKEVPFDVVFMDFVMVGDIFLRILLLLTFFFYDMQPVMGGLEAMQLFDKWRREDPSHINNDHMLLVGMSANAIPSEQDEAFHAGMHLFASKPVELQYLGWILKERRNYGSIAQVLNAIKLTASLNLEEDHKISSSSGILRCCEEVRWPNRISSISANVKPPFSDDCNHYFRGTVKKNGNGVVIHRRGCIRRLTDWVRQIIVNRSNLRSCRLRSRTRETFSCPSAPASSAHGHGMPIH